MTSRTPSRVVLPPTVERSIRSHARDGAAQTPPREVCGVLGGRRASEEGPGVGGGDDDGTDGDATGVAVVERADPVSNVADDPRTAYRLDPETTVATVDALEADGLDVVGFYHSHPESDPVPSRTDEAEATWTGRVYLICHPDGRLNAYRWTGETFAPLSVVSEA